MSPAAKVKETAHAAEGRNDVVLVGRVSAEPSMRVLPSGDELLSWRLVVGRDAAARAATANAPTIDTIDCIAYKAAVRRLGGTLSRRRNLGGPRRIAPALLAGRERVGQSVRS